MASTVYINPTAKSGGTGTQASPYNSWSQVKFTAGNTYLQAAGTTYNGTLFVGTHATASSSIVIGSYGTGTAPQINGAVDFDGATYVKFSGFTVSDTSGAGVILQDGANDINIASNTITKSQIGIWIGNAAGATNTINGNTIVYSGTSGIAIDDVTGSGTVISNNVIGGSGGDGISVDGNKFTIEDNNCSDNGQTYQGASGIHLFTGSASEGYGDNNIVTGNVCTGNLDIHGEDGNGIIGDQWTNNNTISDNFCDSNDGAGIVLYDSYNNTVNGNTCFDNEVNLGGTHSCMGDFVLNESLGLTKNNTIENNVFLSGQSSPAVFVDGVDSGGNNNFISNVMENMTGGDIYEWNGYYGSSLSFWNANASSTDKFSGAPLTADSAGITPSYLFPAGAVAWINDSVVNLYGWAPGYGLLTT